MTNTATIRSGNADACVDVELRQSKYLNNLVEQEHQGVKKGQLHCPNGKPVSAATQFYNLAF